MMVIAILLTLNIGIAIGWYGERLLRIVTALLERKPVSPGVVKTEVMPGMQPQHTGSIVRSRSPKEVAADQNKKFNDEFQI